MHKVGPVIGHCELLVHEREVVFQTAEAATLQGTTALLIPVIAEGGMLQPSGMPAVQQAAISPSLCWLQGLHTCLLKVTGCQTSTRLLKGTMVNVTEVNTAAK